MIKYFNYNNIFLAKNVIEFPKHLKINYHNIQFEKNKQLFFRLIYYFNPIKLKILKTYIKTNLANSFI